MIKSPEIPFFSHINPKTDIFQTPRIIKYPCYFNFSGVFMKKIFCFLVFFILPGILTAGSNTEIQFLSGRGSDQTENWKFMVTAGRQANQWTEIPVPSCWEFHGFGTFNYGHDEEKGSEQGKYRHSFTVPELWNSKKIFIVFEGSMTDTEVKINGLSAGPVHQGGFYRFQYDISELLLPGQDNLLEVYVNKMSSNASINAAERTSDFWVFGGIFRPVYLKAVPREFITRTAISARHNGSFSIDVYPESVDTADRVSARLINPDGTALSGTVSVPVKQGAEKITLQTKVSGQKNWTAENPTLYYADIRLLSGNTEIHAVRERFGFRTIEIRQGQGIFLNESPIVLKGVNRHSFRPETGRALSRQDCLEDILNMKDMNMNAVRMSHYPPDKVFLDLCDEYGLYVLDELAGWQKPPYDTATGERLLKAMVITDVNHPSVLFWDNGNEGGWNRALDDDFALYDPQNRQVLHPHELHSGIDTDHYESYESTLEKLKAGNIFMPTEYLHGLYDGGLGAGLDDYWRAMWGHPLNGGMFLWVFADEGVVRGDLNGFIDTDGNHAPDGILGPHGEREASYYTIKEIWSPVYFDTNNDLPADFAGRIPVENRYDFSNLNRCRFEWELVRFRNPGDGLSGHVSLAGGKFTGPDIPARAGGEVRINLPVEHQQADALKVTAFDWNDCPLHTWTWTLATTDNIRSRIVKVTGSTPAYKKGPQTIDVTAGITIFQFDLNTGGLRSARSGSHHIPFGDGPVLQISGRETSSGKPEIILEEKPSSLEIMVKNHPDFSRLEWSVYGSGWLKLKYGYDHDGPVDYMGISFNYPEIRMNGMSWLGRGPFRVWKNRLKGGTLDVWNNTYNSFQANTAWNYPEFPGYYADFSWASFKTDDGPITIATDTPDLFLRVYRQEDGEDPRHTAMKWPGGDISLLHAIPAIGTKFLKAEDLGPQGRRFPAEGSYSGTLWFYFGRPGESGTDIVE